MKKNNGDKNKGHDEIIDLSVYRMSKAKKSVIKISCPEETVSRLKELEQLSGAKNVGEVISNALRTYEWVLKLPSQGNKLAIETSDGQVCTVTFKY